MASSSSSQLELGELLKDAGNQLLTPPSPIDELLSLLDKVELLLSKVEQSPSTPMQDALFPSMKALIASELLRHSNMDVKVSVVSCISEIIRITAPDAPYDDDLMKEIFQLTVMALEKLSHESGRCYTKAISILDTVAKVRSCLVMLDLECDELIVEMFQQFLSTIRSNHPQSVFLDMETTMTLVINESEEISMELLLPLLNSLKKEKQNSSSLSWELGEKVMRNCAATLKPYLREAVESMGIAFNDYAEVVASICQDSSEGEDLENGNKFLEIKDSDEPSQVSKALMPDAAGMMNDGTAQIRTNESVHNLSPSKTLECCQTKQHEGTDAGTEVQPVKLDSSKAVKQAPESVPKKRGRKPNSLIKPEEGYVNSWLSGGRIAAELPRCKKSHGKKIGSTSSQLPTLLRDTEKEAKAQIFSHKTSHDGSTSTSLSLKHNSAERSHPKRGRPKKKQNVIDQDGGLDLVSVPKGGSLSSHVKKKASHSADVTLRKKSEGKRDSEAKVEGALSKTMLAANSNEETTPALGNVIVKNEDGSPGNPGEKRSSSVRQMGGKKMRRGKATTTPGNIVVKKEDGVPGDPKGKQESSVRQMSGKKHSRDRTTSEGRVLEESDDKEKVSLSVTKPLRKVDSQLNKTSKTKCKGKHNLQKEEVSETTCAVKAFGEELVGCKIKVWWPMDQKFYDGVIDSFEPIEKKHKVLYTDGDEEVLKLCEERWKLIGKNTLPNRGQETDLPSSEALSDMLQKRRAKTNSEHSIKHENTKHLLKRDGASASKSKVEVPKSGSKPTEGSILDTLCFVAKLKDGISESFDMPNDDGQKSTSKSKTEIPKTKPEGEKPKLIANPVLPMLPLSHEVSGEAGKEKMPDPVDKQESETKSVRKRRRLVKSSEILSQF